jgi:hypothetical protein
MKYSVNISSRNFTGHQLSSPKLDVLEMTWSTMGYCDKSKLRMYGSISSLLNFTKLIRCPITISNSKSEFVWWGFISKISIVYQNIKFTVDINDLYNSVIVSYTSPQSDLPVYADVEDNNSISEYGSKTLLINKTEISGDYASTLADYLLSVHKFPKTLISKSNLNDAALLIDCSGWFSTLGWSYYNYPHGFISNQEGPGTLQFAQSSTRREPGQVFLANDNLSLSSVEFKLSRYQATTRTLTARLYSTSGTPAAPNTLLATSTAIPATDIPDNGFAWIKFNFATPYSLTAGTYYFISVRANLYSSTNYFYIRTDEDANYENGRGYYWTGSWVRIPFEVYDWWTYYYYYPDLHFRLYFTCDPQYLLDYILSQSDQFFSITNSIAFNSYISPYTPSYTNCLSSILDLLDLGARSFHPIFAHVDADRILTFYVNTESKPTVLIDNSFNLFTSSGMPIPKDKPPIGQLAVYKTDQILEEFDLLRLPSIRIRSYSFFPLTGRISIS